MASGVKVDNSCLEAFKDYKLGKKYAFVIFGFNDAATHIITLHKEPKVNESNKNGQWEKLIEMLPANDVRYAVADLDYNIADGQRKEMLFISWAPETASIKRKMIVASSQTVLRNALVGVSKTIQACGYPDLELKSVVEKFKGFL